MIIYNHYSNVTYDLARDASFDLTLVSSTNKLILVLLDLNARVLVECYSSAHLTILSTIISALSSQRCPGYLEHDLRILTDANPTFPKRNLCTQNWNVLAEGVRERLLMRCACCFVPLALSVCQKPG
jgi:hypothetical protein